MTQNNTSPWRRIAATVSIAGVLASGICATTGAQASPPVGQAVAAQSAGAPAVQTTSQSAGAPASQAASQQQSTGLGFLGGAGSQGAAQAALDSDVQKRGRLGPIIDWIKKNVPSIWNSMKDAVRRGWEAFKNWWNGLASWVRAAIDFLWQGSLWELFSAIYDYFF